VPVFAGDAGVVEFAGEDFEGLAVEGEVIALDGEGVGLLGKDGAGGEAEKEYAKFRFQGTFHEGGIIARRIFV
jgi:hypothetical protein